MQRKHWQIRVVMFLALVGIMISSCMDASEDLTAPLDESVSQLQANRVQPISEEDAELREFTRRLAIALGSDPALRRQLVVSLSTSPYREEKRHLRTLITQVEPRMLTGIARAGNGPADSVLATLDKITDLEMYLPVEEHRSRWTGGSELIVASALGDDSSLPIHAFDLEGEPVLLSWSKPPETPVLAVVPNETDFSDPWESGSVELSVATTQVQSLSMPPASAVLTRLDVPGDWEGWLMGSAEMEMHATNANGTYVKCGGELKGSPLYFDTQGGVWTGEVMLEVDYSPGTRYFEMWEDDTDPCKGEKDGVQPKTTSDIKQIVNGTITTAIKLIETATAPGLLKKLQAAAGLVSIVDVISGVNKDDLVGRIMIPDHCWPNPINSPTYSIKRGGTVNGTAKIELRMDGAKEPICPPNPHISGPSLVDVGSTQTWKSNVTKGVSPYVYRWYRDGHLEGTSANYTWTVVGGTDFTLRVEVTDSHSPPRTVSPQQWRIVVQSNCEPHDPDCEG